MKIGVLFPSRVEDVGDYLADARAVDAAGVDSIWLEDRETLDPLLIVAAIAAVTGRVRLVLLTDGVIADRQRETLLHVSRGRFVVLPGSHLAGGQAGGWRQVSPPEDREAWSAILQANQDVEGIVVPMSPGLLDILRHPDEAIDRSDLILAQG